MPGKFGSYLLNGAKNCYKRWYVFMTEVGLAIYRAGQLFKTIFSSQSPCGICTVYNIFLRVFILALMNITLDMFLQIINLREVKTIALCPNGLFI